MVEGARLGCLVAPLLSVEERNEVTVFLDAGEYGVALEALCEILKEDHRPVPAEFVATLRELGRSMGMTAAIFDHLDSS